MKLTALLMAIALVMSACSSGSSSGDAAAIEASDGVSTPAAQDEPSTGEDEEEGESEEEQEEDPTESAPTTSTTEPTEPDEDTSTSPTTEEYGPDSPASFTSDATPLVDQFSPVEPGTYLVTTLGTPFSFTTTEAGFVQFNRRGVSVYTDPDSRGPDDRDLVMSRLTDLSDPANPTFSVNIPDSWGTDYRGWIDAMSDKLDISRSEETTLGGRPAFRADFTVGDIECNEVPPCLSLGSNHDQFRTRLNSGSQYRTWLVDQGDFDPIFVLAAVLRDEDSAWFDTADAILATLAFGEISDNTIVVRDAGPLELPFLGGIGLELTKPSTVIDDPSGWILLADNPGVVKFVTGVYVLDGAPLDTTDAVIGELTSQGAELVEVARESIGGLEARVFDLGVPSTSRVQLRLRPDVTGNWNAAPRARIWLIEHPERGLLMMSAETEAALPNEAFPEVLAEAQDIVSSVEFIDLS